jgi:hypothetical protein
MAKRAAGDVIAEIAFYPLAKLTVPGLSGNPGESRRLA